MTGNREGRGEERRKGGEGGVKVRWTLDPKVELAHFESRGLRLTNFSGGRKEGGKRRGEEKRGREERRRGEERREELRKKGRK